MSETLTRPQNDESNKEDANLDLNSLEMTVKFREAPIYKKTAIIDARPVQSGESIKTVLANGKEETSNVDSEGGYVITNPGGEQYIVAADEFESKYSLLPDGKYSSKGMIRAMDNPTGEDITVLAPWGELMHGEKDCIVASTYNLDQPDEVSKDRYIIGREEFEQTYKPSTN